MRSLSSIRHVPSSGRRLLATAGLAALAVVGATVSGVPGSSVKNLQAMGNVALISGPRAGLIDPVPIDTNPGSSDLSMANPGIVAAPLSAATTPPPTTPPPATPTATPPPPVVVAETPVLKLAANHASVTAGAAVVFTATVRHRDGKAIPAEVAQLQEAAKGAWKTIASVKTAATGVATFTVKPTASYTYQVIVPAVTSNGVKVLNSTDSGNVVVKTIAKAVNTGAAIVREAAKFAGHRYVFGAAGPKYFDCSGLVLYVYKHVTGINLPHKASEQAHYGVRVSRKDARPGDLIFFHTSSGYVHHVAIYTGGDMMWEAPHTGSVVRHVKIWSNAIEFRRLIK